MDCEKDKKMNSFKFGTKAETLDNLRFHIREAKIPKQIYFSLKEWNNRKKFILDEVINKFNGLVIVRSSAKNEDTFNSSKAGNYQSITNVKLESSDVARAIESVFKSYSKDSEINIDNQVIVQPQVENIIMSGVIFTRCKDYGGPYYIINYDDFSGKSDTVTSGNSSSLKTFSYFKYLERVPSNTNLAKLIKIARELEKVTGLDKLDIEFAINPEGVYVLQVRPLTTIDDSKRPTDEDISKTIEKIKLFIENNDKKFPNIYGYKSIFGLMPDWNPAEIIGESPRPLAFSLYRELITDFIWPLSRKEIGYKDVGYHPGIVSLGGKPYVDTRLSFNTFLPATLTDNTAEKLVNFYIDKLINNPEFHDKIEFKVALTCYKFGFEKNEIELKQNNFSNLQIREIKDSLRKLTEDIINEKITSIDEQLNLNNLLNERRAKIIKSDIELDVKIAQLIHDCKFLGTLPFSKLARFSFIGNIMISSLVESNVLTQNDKDMFFKSINSIATEFVNKLSLLSKNLLSKEDFLEDFGHLRPGTYDLCSPTYREKFEEYFKIKKNKDFEERTHIEFNFSKEKKDLIQKAIQKESLNINADKFLNFTRKALAARERSKYEFSKNLSLILDYCYEFMRKFGFTKEEITFLEINDIVSFSHKSKSINELEELRMNVEKNKAQYEIMKSLRLPPLIYMPRNVEYFHQFDNNPNFITQNLVTGEILELNEKTEINQLNGKILLIKNADPGYDWVFGHNIKGLITEYGGVASHMSIRCAEFGLPAAIGCGESVYDYVKRFNTIELNCATKQIKGII